MYSSLRLPDPRMLPVYQWLLAVFVLYLLVKTILRRRKGPLPPGPRGLPLLGNVLQLPSKFQYLRFTEWKDEFGPIFSLNLAGTPVVVLNDCSVAADLLDRRSTIYSDRPRFIVAGEILTGGVFLPFAGYGDLWRKLRKAGHEGLNIRAAEKYQPLQVREATALVAGMISDPESWDDHIKRSAASTVLSAIYAWPQIESKDDPVVTRVNDWVHRFAKAAIPGAHLVEIFPIMKLLPECMAAWKREGLELHRKDTEMLEEFMDSVSRTMAEGEYKPSFAASLLERKGQHGLSKKETSWLAGTMFGAGSETTAAALSVFMLAMVLYPDVMRKAQREIDAVVGRSRLPTFADRTNLPYIRALFKEVLRWKPVGPLSIPRRTVQDDWYKGYFIPKGTIVIANLWAMNHDPEFFPDPDVFRPERYLDGNDGKTFVAAPDTHGQGHSSYGFGRRICIGMHVANNALFIDIAALLWAANIERAVDAEGKCIIPSPADCLDEGLVVRPVPFKCNIIARSKDVDGVIETAREAEV